jgi:hypothetical protein
VTHLGRGEGVTHSNTSVTVGVTRGVTHCTRRRVQDVPSGFMDRRTESDMEDEE